jgi:ABC-2 type transport system permease protein
VFLTFARNSLVREMTFRANFILETISSLSWVLMNLGFYVLVFDYTPMIGQNSGWGKYEFFVFLATTLLVNSLVQALFMTNADEFSELIRNGSLDFALLKPIDTQFLVSLQRIDWSAMANFLFGLFLLGVSLWKLEYRPGLIQSLLYPVYVTCGVAILYALMIALSATSVWLGRNQTLYDFWFYITNFARYPMEIYTGRFGTPLRHVFTFLIPVLIVVNVPARLLVRPLAPHQWQDWLLPVFTLFATGASLLFSRWIFQRALLSYRSASS